MRLNSVIILKIKITSDSRQKILEEIQKYLLQSSIVKAQLSKPTPKPVVIATPNPEQIVLARKNFHFAGLLNQADIAIPDGMGVVWAVRFLSKLSAFKRIPGVEFMEDLVQMAATEGFGIALIGGRGGLAVETLERLQLKYPDLRGWAENPGEIEDDKFYNSYNFYNLYKKIRDTGVRMVFVGLGAPKQEYFIARLARSCQLSAVSCQLVFMSVGGTFEMIAGKIQRAPLFIRLLGFEWVWRLIREPWRWRRQLALVEFIRLVAREKFLQIFIRGIYRI